MDRRLLVIVGVVLVVAGILLDGSLFIVDQTEQALVLQFGQPKRTITTPGLFAKWPFVENVIYFDKRVLPVESAHEEVIVSDQKRVVVDTYTRYKILDPLLFYQTVNSEDAVRNRLDAIVNSATRRVLGGVTLSAILSEQRGAIMRHIRDEVATEAKGFGVGVVDVRIRRADLPPENSEAIYARMQSERQQQAAEYRAEGQQAALTVRAEADRERTVIIADAQRDAQRVRGQGDATAIAIYAKAFSQDKAFFAFYRSMEAYRHALNGQNTTFVLTPDSGFFRYLENPTGGIPPTPPNTARAR
jgi:modulator of FtsH protease HflC